VHYTVDVAEAEARVTIAVRVSKSALKMIDEMAEREDRSRSDVIRRLLAYGVWKMPPGWRPPKTNETKDGRS
jgi:hypothetical protein